MEQPNAYAFLLRGFNSRNQISVTGNNRSIANLMLASQQRKVES